jgi:hypothetical protein
MIQGGQNTYVPGASINWRGAYNGATAYAQGDGTTNAGSSYLALVGSTGVTPGTDGTKWQLLANAGTNGSNGTNGTNGTNGVGVPAGGTTGQVLAKNSGANYDTGWVDESGGVITGTPGNLPWFDPETGNLEDSGLPGGPDSSGDWADSGGLIYTDPGGAHADSSGIAAYAEAHADSGGHAGGARSHANSQGTANQGGDYASGAGAVTYLPGQKAIANGQFTNPASAQKTEFLLRITDPNNGSAIEPFVDGDAQSIPWTLPAGVASTFHLIICAQRGDGAIFGGERQGIVYPWNEEAVISLVGTDQYTGGASGWSVNIQTPNNYHAQLQLLGDGSNTEIQWVVYVVSVETHY